MTERAESWAEISSGGESAHWRSTSWRWPPLVPGMASTELSQLGLRLHRPPGLRLVSKMWSCVGDEVKVNTCRLSYYNTYKEYFLHVLIAIKISYPSKTLI